MTLLNIHIKEKEKKKLQEYIAKNTDKSMSEFVRELVAERMKIEEIVTSAKNSEFIEIPDYVPKNQYVAFVKGAVVAIGSNPSDLAEIALQKFPSLPVIIKYNGSKQQFREYCYAALHSFTGWSYVRIEDHSFPVIPIIFYSKDGKKGLNASIDTASSLCLLKTNQISPEECALSRKERIATAAGILEAPIYKGKVTILDVDFDIEFLLAPLDDSLPFKFLIGRNLLDQLDALFMGKKQVLLLRLAEE